MFGRAKINLAAILFFILSVLLGGFFGFSLVFFVGDNLDGITLVLNLLLSFLLFLAAFILQIIIHELGHLTIALARGWKFISFMIMGLILTRREGRYRISSMKLAGAAGQCLLSPPEKGDSDFGIILYNMGGVLFNLIFLTVSIIWLSTCHESLHVYLNIFLLLFSIVGIFFVLINAIPCTMSGIPNDGYNILNLRKDQFSTRIFLDSLRFQATIQGGERPQEAIKRNHSMADYYSDSRVLDMSNPFHVCALTMDLAVALDKMDFSKARSLISVAEQNWNQIIPIYQYEIGMERLFLLLIDYSDPEEIEKALNDKNLMNYLNRNATFRPSALRVKYAIALLHDKDPEQAAQIMEKYNRISGQYYNIGDALSEKDLMKAVSDIPSL